MPTDKGFCCLRCVESAAAFFPGVLFFVAGAVSAEGTVVEVAWVVSAQSPEVSLALFLPRSTSTSADDFVLPKDLMALMEDATASAILLLL